MQTRTRTGQRPSSGGRFPRQLAPTRRAPTPTRRPVPRPPMRIGRRPPQKSNLDKALEGITGLLNRSGGKSGAGRGRGRKGKAGMAFLAGAAGLAFKNRDKLTSRFGRKHDSQAGEPTPAAHGPEVPGAAAATGAPTGAPAPGESSDASF
jgi:hypothetical protein